MGTSRSRIFLPARGEGEAVHVGAVDGERPAVSGMIFETLRLTVQISGAGKKRMAACLQERNPDRVDGWIALGFSGSLLESLPPGSCLAGERVIEPGGPPIAPPPLESALFHNQNLLLCTDQILSTPQSKRQMHHETGADLVDMESAAVARHALSRGEPFGWIRGITDSAGETLPDALLSCLDEQGFPSFTRAVKLVLKQPAMLLFAARLGWRSQAVSRRLAEAAWNGLQEYAEHSR